jgi:hypothetical protein
MKSFLNLVLEEERGQSGYSLLELLWGMAMSLVLAALAFTAFYTYMDKAEYASAFTMLRTNRPSLEDGEMQVGPGFVLPLTYSSTTGGRIVGPMAAILPGAVTADNQRLGVSYRDCTAMSPPVQVNAYLLAESCNSARYMTWYRLCNGAQFFVHNISKPSGCS